MVRLKSSPRPLTVTQQQNQTWSLTGTESFQFEEQILKLIEFSRVNAAEEPTTPEKSSSRKRGHGKDENTKQEPRAEMVFKEGSSYVERLCDASEASLDAACIVKLKFSSSQSLKNCNYPVIKLRTRSFQIVSEKSVSESLRNLLFHSTGCLDLYYDFAENKYVLVRNDGNFASGRKSVKFSFAQECYADFEVLSAVSFLSRKKSIFLTMQFSDDELNSDELWVTEYLNGSLALDFGSIGDSFIYDPQYLMKRAISARYMEKFLQHVFWNRRSSEQDNLLPDHEKGQFLNPDDMNTILRLCQTESDEVSPVGTGIQVEQSSELIPLLRPYQKAAVEWMLKKERHPTRCFVNFQDESVHPLMQKVNIPTVTQDQYPKHFFINFSTGQFAFSRPLAFRPQPGGVLADEMGLGKALEVLELILKHPRSEFDQYSFPNFDIKDESVHPLMQKVNIPTVTQDEYPKHFFINFSTGQFAFSRPLAFRPQPGGVLADEMGLGKTLEVLELILKHPRSEFDQYSFTNFHIKEPTNIPKSSERVELESDDDAYNCVDLFCVCGNISHDYNDDEDRRLGNPLKCVQCQSWMHPACFSQLAANRLKRKRKFDDEDLGRTVFDHRMKRFVCPFCVVEKKDVVPTKATLIVTPGAICNQWLDEISQHVKEGTLKILNYSGVNSKQKFIQPKEFENYDVVITTFEILRSELLHTNLHDDNKEIPSKRAQVPKQKLLEADPHPCRLRRPKRYRALPSPLTCVQWWRLCVDEAQQIECHTAQATEMLLRLQCVNKWCVTGTPIRRSIEDVYGLMLFLQIDPLYVKHWWKEFVVNPLKKPISSSSLCKGSSDETHNGTNKGLCDLSVVLKALKFIMWRTCKDQVRDQICIPKQHIHTKMIDFSPIESHFYNRKKRKYAERAFELIGTAEVENGSLLSEVQREIAKKILATVGDLRKTCIHPQMVKGFSIGVGTGGSQLMTMEQLLGEMQVKAVRECEETVRQICTCLNGIAGLKWIQAKAQYVVDREKMSEAVEVYRDVLLRVSNYSREGLRSDALPKIHSLYNLHQILYVEGFDAPKTLRDSALLEECETLKLEYLSVFEKDVTVSLSKLSRVVSRIDETRSMIDFNSWLAEISASIVEFDCELELVDKVYTDLQRNLKSVREDFRTIIGLEYFVYTHLEEVKKQRDACIKSVHSLNCVPNATTIEDSYECHLKLQQDAKRNNPNSSTLNTPKKQPKKTCKFCVVHNQLLKYEKLLFDSSSGNQTIGDVDFDSIDTNDTSTMWKPSRLELICCTISAFAISKKLPETDQESAKNVKSFLGLIREEFKTLRDYWRCLTNRVAGHDELRMATERFRLFDDGTDSHLRTDELSANVLRPHMVPITLKRLETDLAVYENELLVRKGRKTYLQNLEKSKKEEIARQENKTAESGDVCKEMDPCPVCKGPFESQWAVFACGHSFCLKCLSLLLDDPNYSSAASSSSSLSSHISPLALMTPKKSKVKCPMCRKCAPISSISYVTLDHAEKDMGKTGSADSESAKFGEQVEEHAADIGAIKGDLSAKTHQIVCTVKDTLASDDKAKFLIFSSWNEVLSILASALEMNEVPFLLYKSSGAFQGVLNKFKRDNVYPVLLLPYKTSSSGLNIIEANHVVIVEPVLNPAAIHQAIGRVDRISQNRETHVHFLVISDSVEDKLCQLVPQFNNSSSRGKKFNLDSTPAISLQDVKEIFT